jgi:hypothetical protein
MENNTTFIIGIVCMLIALGLLLYGLHKENIEADEQYKRDKK